MCSPSTMLSNSIEHTLSLSPSLVSNLVIVLLIPIHDVFMMNTNPPASDALFLGATSAAIPFAIAQFFSDASLISSAFPGSVMTSMSISNLSINSFTISQCTSDAKSFLCVLSVPILAPVQSAFMSISSPFHLVFISTSIGGP